MTNDISRLRRLRKTALKVRALASTLNAGPQHSKVYQRAALLSWRIARIATGRLRSHPYQSYQKDPGYFESGADRINAYVLAALAQIRGQGMRVFLDEILGVARELDDTRALTLSAELSEALGRAQYSMRAIIDEIHLQIASESGEKLEDRTQDNQPTVAANRLSASPYLAL